MQFSEATYTFLLAPCNTCTYPNMLSIFGSLFTDCSACRAAKFEAEKQEIEATLAMVMAYLEAQRRASVTQTAPRIHIRFLPYGWRNALSRYQGTNVAPPQPRARGNSLSAPSVLPFSSAPAAAAPGSLTFAEALQAAWDQSFGPPPVQLQVAGSVESELTANIEEAVEASSSADSDDEFLAVILGGGSVDSTF
ncbi:hypothetical protein C8R46DRAFT_1048128 [Mycena filopes]|nr:hypothetical protein C8R46DRAFT_1048128 [Mycena filopes]